MHALVDRGVIYACGPPAMILVERKNIVFNSLNDPTQNETLFAAYPYLL